MIVALDDARSRVRCKFALLGGKEELLKVDNLERLDDRDAEAPDDRAFSFS